MALTFEWPIKIVSEANKREYHLKKAQRTKLQRDMVRLLWKARDRGVDPPPLPLMVHLVYQGPRPLDDDNLAGAFKHVRDELAICLLPPRYRTVKRGGVKTNEQWADDSDPRLLFTYSQIKARKYGIKVVLLPATEEELSILRDPPLVLDMVRRSVMDRSPARP